MRATLFWCENQDTRFVKILNYSHSIYPRWLKQWTIAIWHTHQNKNKHCCVKPLCISNTLWSFLLSYQRSNQQNYVYMPQKSKCVTEHQLGFYHVFQWSKVINIIWSYSTVSVSDRLLHPGEVGFRTGKQDAYFEIWADFKGHLEGKHGILRATYLGSICCMRASNRCRWPPCLPRAAKRAPNPGRFLGCQHRCWATVI